MEVFRKSAGQRWSIQRKKAKNSSARQVKHMGATLIIKNDLAKRLEILAKTTRQSKSSLASQAIEEFLTVQEWHIQAIKEGIAAADRGDFISHEEAIVELKKWGSGLSR